MIKVGDLSTEGGGGSIYKVGDSFFFRYHYIGMDREDNERTSEGESKAFSSLEALRSHYKGFSFRAAGSSEYDLNEIKKLLSGSADQLDRLRALYAERSESDKNGRMP